MDNLVNFFNLKTKEFSKNVCLRMEREGKLASFTYSQVREFSDKLKNVLFSKGFKKSDKIAILSENRPEWGIVFFGVLSLGAVLVPIDAKLSKEEMEFILKDSGAKAVFCSEKFSALLQTPGISAEIFLLDEIETSPAEAEAVEIYPTDTALLVYTSGATGKAKGVILSHFNLLSNVNMVHDLFHPEFSKAGFLSILPLHHTFEITGGFLSPISLGGTVTYVEDLKGETLARNLKKFKPEVMLVVPVFLSLFYNGILKQAKLNPWRYFIFNVLMKKSFIFYKLGIKMGRFLFAGVLKKFGARLRYFVSGAAPLDVKVAQQIELLGFEVLEGYGLTETSPILTVNTLKEKKLGSVGKPLPWVEVKIDKRGEAKEGEILAKGSNVMQGYYKRPDLTGEVLKEGWFHTGDIGYFDSDGFLYICGREKNVIVTSSGKNVYPEELEDKFSREIFIREICILGMKRKRGEEIVAVIVPEERAFEDKFKIKEIIKEKIDKFNRSVPEYKRISDFIVWEGEFPKTTTLKIKKAILEEKINEKEKESKQEALEETKKIAEEKPDVQKLLEITSTLTKIPPEEISLKDRLYEDLGIDSLAKVEFACEIEKAFNIKIGDEDIMRFYTLEDIFDCISKDFLKIKRENKLELSFLKGPSLFIDSPAFTGRVLYNFRFWFSAQIIKFLRYSFHLFYRLFAKIFFRLEFSGLENLPRSGPFILSSNHAGHIDSPSILSVFPLADLNNIFSPAAGDYFQKHPKAEFWAHAFFNTFSFARHGNYMEGLKACVEILKAGKKLLIFPEGALSRDGTMQEFKSGVGEIAYEAKVPVVPVYIQGSYEAYPTGRYYPKPCKVKIYFGKPINIGDYENLNIPRHLIYKEITRKIKEEICFLLTCCACNCKKNI